MFSTGSYKPGIIKFFAAIVLMGGVISIIWSSNLLLHDFNLYNNHHTQKAKSIESIPGHWLMTNNLQLELYKSGYHKFANQFNNSLPEKADVQKKNWPTEQKVDLHLNKKQSCINILYLWEEAGRLKVASIMTLNKSNKKPAVLVIPLNTCIGRNYETVQETYQAYGKDGVLRALQNTLEVKIDNYVILGHAAMVGLSDVLGNLTLGQDRISMVNALEQSVAGIRTNDDTIVQEVARQAIRPRTLLQLPKIIQLFKEHVETDLSIQQVLYLLNYTKSLNVDVTKKVVLPGEEHIPGYQGRRVISSVTWHNIMYWITE